MTLGELYNPGPLVELACQRLLDQLVPTFKAGDGADLPAAFVTIAFSMGSWADRWGLTASGEMVHSAWRYTLTLKLESVRRPDEPVIHPQFCAEIRAALATAVRNPSFLAWHSLPSCNEVAGTESIQVGDDADVSAMVFEGLVVIREDVLTAIP